MFQDNFAQKHLPSQKLQPDYIYNHPDFQLPEALNCVERLLDSHVREGRGHHIAMRTFEKTGHIRIYMKKRTRLQMCWLTI